MKIAAARAWLQKLPLKKPYSIAYKNISDTQIVFVELILENGIVGLGAANPFEEVVGESPLTTLQNLQSGFLDGLVGKNIEGFNKMIEDATTIFPLFPGTVAAIDIALHDAFCKYKNIAVVDFLGRKKDGLLTSITIGIKETAAMVEEAKANIGAGFKILKIKTGIAVEEDAEHIIKLKALLPSDILIRVDANQGYTKEQLHSFINQTKDCSVELIEQPLPVGKENDLLFFDELQRKKFVADESLLNAVSAQQFATLQKPFGVYNIKLMKCGGIKAAMEIAAVAHTADIDLFWGCNDESIISIAAALHIAYACSNTKYLDLDGSFDLSSDIVSGGFIVKDGKLFTTDKPGLGFEII